MFLATSGVVVDMHRLDTFQPRVVILGGSSNGRVAVSRVFVSSVAISFGQMNESCGYGCQEWRARKVISVMNGTKGENRQEQSRKRWTTCVQAERGRSKNERFAVKCANFKFLVFTISACGSHPTDRTLPCASWFQSSSIPGRYALALYNTTLLTS